MKNRMKIFKFLYITVILLFILNCGIADNLVYFDISIHSYAASNTQIVVFEKNTQRNRSKTITIPNLVRITSVTPDTGSVKHSINGNTVTLEVSGGSIVDSVTDSKYINDHSVNTGETEPSQKFSYNSGGYSGTLSLFKADYTEIKVGVKEVFREFSTYHDNTLTEKFDKNGNRISVSYSWDGTNDHPTISINEDGFVGTIPKVSTSIVEGPTITYNSDGSWERKTTYRGYYQGTLKKTVDDIRPNWTGHYSGWVYGSTTYYYAYNVTLEYITNQSPSITVQSPVQNQIFNGTTMLTSIISVSDPDGDTLTCKVFVDSETSPRDTKTVSNTKTAQNISFSSINLGTLSQGDHTIKFTVYDGEETKNSTINFKIDRTKPIITNTTINTTSSSITISGTATDNISLHTEPYRYANGSNFSQWTKDASKTFDSLSPNTLYNIKFIARDMVDNIAEINYEVYTQAAKPTLAVTTKNETNLNLIVTDNNPTYTKYLIKCGNQYVAGDGRLTASAVWITLPSKEIVVSSLQPNKLYEFTVKARNESGQETDESNKVSVYTLAQPPQNIRADSIMQNQILLKWNSVQGATGYDIEVDGVIKDNGTQTQYSHFGLQPETEHRYRVRTRNSSGPGEWSGTYAYTTLPMPPGIPEGITYMVEKTSIKLSWNPVEKANGYDIEVDGVIQDNGMNRTYIHYGLEPYELHTYRIRAKNSGGAGTWSEYLKIRTLPNPPNPPESINTDITKNTIKISWDAIPIVDRYDVEVDGLIISTNMVTEFLHEGLTPYTRHQYRIRGVNAGGVGEWSKYFYVTTYPYEPNTPENLMAASDGDSISLSWYMASYAWTYEIEIDGQRIEEVYGTQFTHEGLIPGTQHSYRVRSKNISGTSEWTNPVKITASSGVMGQNMNISNLAAIVTTDTITLSWDSVSEECQYEVEADGVLINNGFSTVFHHGGLDADTLHEYKIRVKSDNKEWGAVLSLATMPFPPGAPVILDYYAENHSIQIWWEPVEGAVSYDVEADGEVLNGITDITYIDKGLLQGTTHQYRVRARTLTDVSPWSKMIEINTGNTEYIVDCVEGEKFNFSLLAYNVQDFNKTTFVVLYDEEELEVEDLFGATPEKDVIESGQIPGTNLSVVMKEGKIEITVKGNIVPGTCWSGEITDIVFRARVTGTTTITFICDNEVDRDE